MLISVNLLQRNRGTVFYFVFEKYYTQKLQQVAKLSLYQCTQYLYILPIELSLFPNLRS